MVKRKGHKRKRGERARETEKQRQPSERAMERSAVLLLLCAAAPKTKSNNSTAHCGAISLLDTTAPHYCVSITKSTAKREGGREEESRQKEREK